MKQVWSAIQLFFAGLGGWIGWFLGGFDGFLYALVAFVIIDYVTGFMRGVFEKNLSSEVGFRGICKKVLIFTMVAVASLVDRSIIGNGEVIRTAVIFFYLSNEGISILENASKIGLAIPEKLKDILSQIRTKDSNGTIAKNDTKPNGDTINRNATISNTNTELNNDKKTRKKSGGTME